MVGTHRVLIVGPTAPPLGGTRVSFDLLRKHIETSSLNVTTIPLKHLKNRYIKIFNELYLAIKIFCNAQDKEVVMLNCDARRFTTLGTALLLGKYTFAYKLVFRPFGADLDLLISNNAIIRILYKFLFPRVDLVFVQTQGLLNFYENNIASNAKLLPTTRQRRGTEYLVQKQDNLKFYYAGHVSIAKGVDLVIEAAKLLLKECPSGWEVNIIGKVKDINLETFDNINFYGEINHSDLMSIIDKQDVLLFPSKHKGEGYPGVIIEAMQAGNAVVVSNWRYLPELIKDNGFVLDSYSPDCIKSVMSTYIENRQILNYHKAISRKRADKFDADEWNEFVVNEIITLCVE